MACQKNHSAIVSRLYDLNESQAVVRGRHICAGCAYEAGFEEGRNAPVQNHEVGELIEALYKEIPDGYELAHDKGMMRFTYKKEDYEGTFPIAVLWVMHREGMLRQMFLEPGTIPN